MAASNIVIVTKNTDQSYTQGGNTVSSTLGVNRLLSVLEVDTNFINLKQGLINLEYTAAPKDSPVFTGTPTAPTAGTGTSTTQIATTAFVVNEISTEITPIDNIVNSSIIGNSALNTKIALKANLSGPTAFSGTTRITGLVNTTVDGDPQHIITKGYFDYKTQNIENSVLPDNGGLYDLGGSSTYWRNLYVNKITPAGGNTSIGTALNPFDEGYFANNTIFIGSAGLSQGAAGGIVLPDGSAFGDEDSVVPKNLISTELDKAFGDLTTAPKRAIKITLTATGTISAGNPVILNSNGTVSEISTTNTSFIGFAATSATNGNDVEIIVAGPVTGLSGLATNSEVLISSTGTLKFSRTQTTDIKIGTATSGTELFLYSTSTIDLYALAKSKAELQDISVNTLAAGNNGLSYNSTTGVFDFTPVNLSTYATQTYVDTEIANLVNSAPTALDTLDELAAALNDDANFATTVTNSLATKAPLASPALTGTPTAPTATSGTNTTQIATTEFVQTAVLNDIELTDLSVSTASASSGGALSYNNTTGVFTFTPADLSAVGNASLNSFSITTNSASGNGSLSYNNTNGVFTFTPADLSGYLTSYTETDPVVGAINGIVKADGAGNISAAVAGTDYSTFDAAFSSLTGTPTTISGYGITDAAPLASPTFTGTPSAPTATTGDSSTQLATTAFVQGEIAGFSTTGGDSQTSFTASGSITANDPVGLNGNGTVSDISVASPASTFIALLTKTGSSSALAYGTTTAYDTLDWNDTDEVYQWFYYEGSTLLGTVVTANLTSLSFTPGPFQTLSTSWSSSGMKYYHISGTSTGLLFNGTSVHVVTNSSGTLSIGSANNIGVSFGDITTAGNGEIILQNGSNAYLLTISGTSVTIGSAVAIGFTPTVFDYSSSYNKLIAAENGSTTLTYTTGTISGSTISFVSSSTTTTGAAFEKLAYFPGIDRLLLVRRSGAIIYTESSAFNGTDFTAVSTSGTIVATQYSQQNAMTTWNAVASRHDGSFMINYGTNDMRLGRMVGSYSSSGVLTTVLSNALYQGTDHASGARVHPPTSAQNNPPGYLASMAAYKYDPGWAQFGYQIGLFARSASVSTRSSYIGIAVDSAADGDSVDVIVGGGVSTGHSGLTPSTTYYVQDSGIFGTTVTTTKAGIALNSTDIQVADTLNNFVPTISFNNLTDVPNTIAGYGINDQIAFTDADIDIGSNDFITTGKSYYANMFATTGDLPSATTYHGMFAHVHGTGKGYFAHAGNWVELANSATTLAGYGITDGATTAYVDTEIANLIDSAPGALDTLNELAAALGDDANFSSTVTNSLALKAPLADPALTGTPTAPTATSGTNTTQVATTAFVQAAISGLGGGASVTVSDAAPSTPSAGDLWFDSTDLVLYVYYNDGDSSQWVQTNPSGSGSSGGSSGGASVTVSGTAPTSPTAGDLWFDDDDLFLYVYVNDGSSSQWVKTNPSGGSSTSTSTWTEKTAAYTAIAGDKLIIDTSSTVTVTLPAAATLGDEIRIIDGTGNAGTNNITIARNGHNIQGAASDLTISTNRAAFGLVYYNTANGWILTER